MNCLLQEQIHSIPPFTPNPTSTDRSPLEKPMPTGTTSLVNVAEVSKVHTWGHRSTCIHVGEVLPILWYNSWGQTRTNLQPISHPSHSSTCSSVIIISFTTPNHPLKPSLPSPLRCCVPDPPMSWLLPARQTRCLRQQLHRPSRLIWGDPHGSSGVKDPMHHIRCYNPILIPWNITQLLWDIIMSLIKQQKFQPSKLQNHSGFLSSTPYCHGLVSIIRLIGWDLNNRVARSAKG